MKTLEVISNLEAVVLLLQHYPMLSGEGIEVASLTQIEEDLGKFSLTRDDFKTVSERWTEADEVPSLAQFLEALQRESKLRVRERNH